MDNLLNDADDKLTFNQYTVSDYWSGEVDESGYPVLTTTVDTVQDVPYELEFNLAANLSADVESVSVEVVFDGETIGSFTHVGGVFETYTFDVVGIGEPAELEFRITSTISGPNSSIDTSGLVPSYEKSVTFLGQDVIVDAFAPGQNYIYQVLNGQLVIFDLETNSYTETETSAAVNVNAIGYSAEQDLIYGIARSNGTDALGRTIDRDDVIAMDATGATYTVSPGVMGSYIGDVDDQGRLWTFNGNLTQAVVYDLSKTNADGSLVHEVISLPSLGVSTRGLADLAYLPSSQTFFGISHGGAAGQPGTQVSIDVSEVSVGGDPTVITQTISGTLVDGEVRSGIPSSAFGATIVDGDGNVYVGANNANHDLDSGTPNSGGFYKITTGSNGDLYMELLADAPRVSSNDGAMDTRGIDPFMGIDTSSTVLLRSPVLSVAVAEDDVLHLAAKGDQVVLDLLANDEVSDGESLTVTHLNGAQVSVGDSLSLDNGEVVTWLGNGLVAVSPGAVTRDVTAEFTYSIQNEMGITDTATVSLHTSPVQGGADNDHMVGFVDADGTSIDGSDGLNDVILGYGGKDKIFAGDGNDDVYGGGGNDFIRAQNGDDLIFGEAGNDILDGGAGADSMYGGDGNDIYFVDVATDVVSEDGGSGTDTVKSKVSYVLGDGLEHLWLKTSADLEGAGNELNNTIVGNSGNNLLQGFGGKDYMLAGNGNDTLDGGNGNDNIQGGAGDDVMYGGDGADQMHGQEGDDVQYGGAGNDTLCPNVGDDTMYGGDGDDLLSGLDGVDLAYGGLGNDVYKVSDTFDTIVEYAGEGHDVVHASADVDLSDHVEDLVFLGTDNLSGSGNAGANRLTGNTGDNTLSGLEGDDYLNGGNGEDSLSGDAGSDKLIGGNGDDTLAGGDGDDTLGGGNGTDVLSGGIGNDFLCGDGGADTFLFRLGDGTDVIKGFDVLEDKVQLVELTANDLTWTSDARGMRANYGTDDSILFSGLSLADTASVDIYYL